MSRRTLITHPLVLRRVDVDRVVDVTPRMRRITVTGTELGAFHRDGFDLPAFASEMFDDHIKLVFAADGDVAAALPVQRARSIDWPPSEHRQGRDYTPRRWDPVAGELDLDFVMHGDGPAAGWAATAVPGSTVHFVGPKSSLVLPDDLDRMLLAGDETALPAIGRFLDDRPVDVPVEVIVEVRDPCAVQQLPLRAWDRLRWVHTGPHAPSGLADAVLGTEPRTGHTYVWVAGESRSLVPLRRRLRHESGIPATHLNITGYWHTDDDRPTDSTPAATLLDPEPWFVTRAAIRLGLLDLVDGTCLSVEDLAERTATRSDALRVLVDRLVSIGVLDRDPVDGGVRTGRIGEALADDEHLRQELFGHGVESESLAALSALPESLRSGVTPWHLRSGRSLAASLAADPELYADAVREAGSFAFVAAGIADLPAWARSRRVAVSGPGSVELLRALADRGRLPDVTVIADGAAARVLTGPARELGVRVGPGPEKIDLRVSLLELRYWTDEECVDAVRAMAGCADVVLVVDALEATGPGAGSDSSAHRLRSFAGTGVDFRDHERIGRLARAAGGEVVGITPLGWDHVAVEIGAAVHGT